MPKVISEKRMGHTYRSAADQAEKMKERGNACFRRGRLAAAIEAYTEAITLCPTKLVCWTNRALCHKRRNDWKQVESDCRKALELDKDCVKALYLLGLAMVEKKQYSEGIKHLEKATQLSNIEQNDDYVDMTWNALAKAKYEEWECVASVSLQKQQELRKICEDALRLEHIRDLKRLESKFHTKVIHLDDDEIAAVEELDVREYQRKLRGRKRVQCLNLCDTYEQRCHTLSEVFEKAAQCNRPAEIPDHLICKITMDILRDPVITPSGITYERSALLEHLKKVGNFDPVTREPLTVNEIIPNYAIKKAVAAYLKDNGWAFKNE